MARGVITEHALSRTGTTTITYVTANSTDDHQFDNSSKKVALLVKNGTASPVTISFLISAVVDGVAIVEGDNVSRDVTVAAGAVAIIGPFPESAYDQSGDVVFVNPSVTDAALKMAAIAY